MKFAAVALATVLLLSASGCLHHGRSSNWNESISHLPIESGFSANFSLSSRSPEVSLRARGQVAVSSHGRMRVEIPGPGGSFRFFMVTSQVSLTAILGSESMFYSDAPDAPILEALFNLELDAAIVAALINGEKKPLAKGCRASAGRWKELSGGSIGTNRKRVPGRLVLDCPGGKLKLHLSDHRMLESPDLERLFGPLSLVPGHVQVSRAEFVETIRSMTQP